jgi:hypothetical protein
MREIGQQGQGMDAFTHFFGMCELPHIRVARWRL